MSVGFILLITIFSVKKVYYCLLVFAVTEASAKPNSANDKIPSWAKPDSEEPPPWARDDGSGSTSQLAFVIPFYAYLLASVVTAIAIEHESIRKSSKNEILEWEDYKAMPFTQCVIHETLRLGGIAIWLPREAKADVEYEDFTIPQGCLVVPFLSAVHLDEGIYPEALQFNPWRWLGEENKVFSFVQLEELIYAGSQGMDIKGPTKCSEHIKDQAKSTFIQPTSYFLPMINERWSGLFEEVRSVLANYTDVRLTQVHLMASNFDTFTDKWSSSNLI